MYVLNLVFSIDNKEGRFSGDDETTNTGVPGPLLKSLNWLELLLNGQPEPVDPYRPPPPPPPPPPPFDPEVPSYSGSTLSWDNLGEAATLLIPNKMYPELPPNQPDPDWICIRAMHHHSGTQLAPTAQAQIVVSFGRPVRAHQKHASPFVDADGHVVTTFVLDFQGMNTSRGWWLPLGRIAKRPTKKKLTHRYEFSVGLIVKSGGQTYYYGEDPEMDIEM